MLLSQKSLGKLFGYTEQAVAKWEKHGKVPKVADAALRLIFSERVDGNIKIGAAVDLLNAIDQISNAKIVVTESKSKWISRIELDEADTGAIL